MSGITNRKRKSDALDDATYFRKKGYEADVKKVEGGWRCYHRRK